jgi:hypothetical protein
MSNGTALRPARLLVCEGPEDHHFFQRLIEANQIRSFCIWPAKGNSRFAQAIRAFQTARTSDYRAILDILIVADNDETPASGPSPNSFTKVCEQIEIVFGPGSAPRIPQQKVSRTATRPSITVLMVPWTDIKGHLERVCVEAARSADQARASDVDTFMGLIHADRWNNESRYAKAWLRTNVAARSLRDPCVAIGHLFSDPRYHYLVPMNHPSLNDIIGFLRGFPH